MLHVPVALSSGQSVQVFCKYNPTDSSAKFMVAQSIASATMFPRIFRSDGWAEAEVVDVSDKDPRQVVLGNQATAEGPCLFVRVKYCDKLWIDRVGQILTENSLTHWVNQGVSVVRPMKPGSLPVLSVLSVRWGGASPVDENRFDFALGDKLIQEAIDALHSVFPQNVEVITVYISHSSDLDKINEHHIMSLMRGSNRVGMYFLWGANHDSKPGYVLANTLHNLMERMETTGIVTKYPYHSSLYKLVTGKEYQAYLSGPTFAIPPTVMCSSAKFFSHPKNACKQAMDMLALVSKKSKISNAVAKVGFEWMGDGVRTFSEGNMVQRIMPLLEGAHGRPPVVLIQERVENIICEPRVFVFNGKVKCIRYTWNEKEDKVTGRVHALRTCPQSRAAEERFSGDRAAQAFVEKKMMEIVDKWNAWLVAASGEVPVFVRIDFLVQELTEGENVITQPPQTVGSEEPACEESWTFEDSETAAESSALSEPPINGELDDSEYCKRFKVWTCELGEVGSSMVGFREGKGLLFSEIAKSCVSTPLRPNRAPPAL